MAYLSLSLPRRLSAAVLSLLIGAAALAHADVLTLVSGEKLTGTLISKTDDQITFQHPVLGVLTIPASQGNVSISAAEQQAEAQVAADVTQAAADTPAAVVATQTEPTAPATEAPKPKNYMEQARDTVKSWVPKGMDGKFSVGYTHIDTGDTSESLALALAVNYTKDEWKYGLRMFYDYATSETQAGVRSTSSDKYGAALIVTRDLTPRWFLENKLTYDHDELLAIRHQVQENISLGYWIFKGEKFTWSVEAGPAVRYTDARGLNEHWYGLATVQETMMYKLNKTLRFDHYANFDLNPADTNQYSWKIYFGLTANITEWIDATLSYEHSDNKMVGPGAQTSEDRIILALGIPF